MEVLVWVLWVSVTLLAAVLLALRVGDLRFLLQGQGHREVDFLSEFRAEVVQ